MLDDIIKKLESIKAKRVLLQAPEGLKTKLPEIAAQLEQRGFEVIISAEPCFGSCDIRDREAKLLDAVLVHIGHSDFGIKPEAKVIYDEWRFSVDPKPMLETNLPILKRYKKIGLLTTLQYIDSLVHATEFLESKKIKCHIGTPVGGTMLGKAVYPGQVWGCDVSAATLIENIVDAFLFMGTGRFHVLGILEKTKKPVLFLNFDTGRIEDVSEERDRLMRIKAANIEEAKGMTHFAILLSTKPGQFRPKVALEIKRRLEQAGKKAWILLFDEIAPDKIIGMHFDVLVNTACPRLSEDIERFEKPILNPEDIDALFEKPKKPSYE
ncbi:MAG: diphthamide biosynthesis enzyme Dph2 [Candidatus Aenigmatarchaeota archaeon]